jgi:hypothetical protein
MLWSTPVRPCLQDGAEHIRRKGFICEQMVSHLVTRLVPDGLQSREEADILIALDRAVPQSCAVWADALSALVVDHVVWSARPTGCVDWEQAHWLMTSLSCGNGPSDNAMRLAFDVVREAHHVDESLMVFVMQAGKASTRRKGHRSNMFAFPEK